MATPALYDMMTLQDVTINKRILTEGVWVQEGYNNTGTYFKRDELRLLIDKILEVILENSHKIDVIHKKLLDITRSFLFMLKTLEKKILEG